MNDKDDFSAISKLMVGGAKLMIVVWSIGLLMSLGVVGVIIWALIHYVSSH